MQFNKIFPHDINEILFVECILNLDANYNGNMLQICLNNSPPFRNVVNTWLAIRETSSDSRRGVMHCVNFIQTVSRIVKWVINTFISSLIILEARTSLQEGWNIL